MSPITNRIADGSATRGDPRVMLDAMSLRVALVALVVVAACESTSPTGAVGAIGGVKEKPAPGVVQDNKHDNGEYRVNEAAPAYQDGNDLILRKRPGEAKAVEFQDGDDYFLRKRPGRSKAEVGADAAEEADDQSDHDPPTP